MCVNKIAKTAGRHTGKPGKIEPISDRRRRFMLFSNITLTTPLPMLDNPARQENFPPFR
jgi:hypothetical protein